MPSTLTAIVTAIRRATPRHSAGPGRLFAYGSRSLGVTDLATARVAARAGLIHGWMGKVRPSSHPRSLRLPHPGLSGPTPFCTLLCSRLSREIGGVEWSRRIRAVEWSRRMDGAAPSRGRLPALGPCVGQFPVGNRWTRGQVGVSSDSERRGTGPAARPYRAPLSQEPPEVPDPGSHDS